MRCGAKGHLEVPVITVYQSGTVPVDEAPPLLQTIRAAHFKVGGSKECGETWAAGATLCSLRGVEGERLRRTITDVGSGLSDHPRYCCGRTARRSKNPPSYPLDVLYSTGLILTLYF